MKYFLIVLSYLLISQQSVQAQLSLTVESGLAINGYNNVRYFNQEANRGTYFSLTDDFNPQQPKIYGRFEFLWTVADKHHIELTAAPLAFDYERKAVGEINFGNDTFNAKTGAIDGRYEFNTYRASYRYQWIDQEKWQLAAGVTVLLRDARIALSDQLKQEETTNLGVVPLLSFDIRYLCSDKLTFLLKGDALASTQGRAEDILLGATYTLPVRGLQLRAGYRIIEGGSDATEVYSFSLFHFAALGVSYTF